MTNPLKLTVFAAFAAVGAGACSSGGSNGETRNDPPPAANNPPTISGTPAQSVTRDQNYAFTPAASDPDGDALTFFIVNQPAWAAFEPATGALTGTPGEIHIGATLDIVISVSDGEFSDSLDRFGIEVLQLFLGSATVSWDIPSTNADGSPMDDLAGFEVHYGSAPGDYGSWVTVGDPQAQSAQIEGLEAGTWYFAVRAFDDAGNRSAFSEEVMQEIRP